MTTSQAMPTPTQKNAKQAGSATAGPESHVNVSTSGAKDVPTLQSLWIALGPAFMPFADAVSKELPWPRLLRLSLFQVSVGLAAVLLTGTLNRVMVVELGIPAAFVALFVAVPLVFAPVRALIGHRSDQHQSAFGWRRGPFMWFGALAMFGGLAIMPFALILLSGDSNAPAWFGQAAAGLAFLLVGGGMHTTQTAGLALATDISPAEKRPQVVAVLYVALLVSMGLSALILGQALTNFSQVRLIQAIQASAVVTMLCTMISLWKQEGYRASAERRAAEDNDSPADLGEDPGSNSDVPSLGVAWARLKGHPGVIRFLWMLGFGTAAFAMQDVLLEPYGADVLGFSVAGSTRLSALLAGGMLAGFLLAGLKLSPGGNSLRLAAVSIMVGILAFTCVIFSGALHSTTLFSVGAGLIGLGHGLFMVCTLTATMSARETLANNDQGAAKQAWVENGFLLGVWGAVQALSAGLAMVVGGFLRDGLASDTITNWLGPAFADTATAYSAVYHVEIILLFLTLAALGPLIRFRPAGASPLTDNPAPGASKTSDRSFGLATLPG